MTREHTAPSRPSEDFVAKRYTVKPSSSRVAGRGSLFLSARAVERAKHETQMLHLVYPFDTNVINFYSDESRLDHGGQAKSVIVTQPALKLDFATVGDLLRLPENRDHCVSEALLRELAIKMVRAVQELHKKGVCHGDLHSRNIMVRGLPPGPCVRVQPEASAAAPVAGPGPGLASTRAPSVCRALFPQVVAERADGPLSSWTPQQMEIAIIDFNLSFAYHIADGNPHNSNGSGSGPGFTGKAGAHFMDASIRERKRFTVIDDLGSLGIILLECALGYDALSSLTKHAQAARGITAADAARYACKMMDAFVSAVLLRQTSDDSIVNSLVPRVPECLRRYLALVWEARSRAEKTVSQADLFSRLDYDAYCKVFN